MTINNEKEFAGMQKVSEAVALTLKAMKEYAKVGMSTKELDNYGKEMLEKLGANSAPFLTYKFPGYACISVNKEFCHGIPSTQTILKEGDLINIDVSAELNGYWADNGGSFILGEDTQKLQPLVIASKEILFKAISEIKSGVKISDIGFLMESEAKKRGLKVIKNLAGHGVGKSLHEQPDDLLNYRLKNDHRKFKKNSVVAIETFITTHSNMAITLKDGWTMVGNKGGHMAQHEHTLVITDGAPIILTEMNEIFTF